MAEKKKLLFVCVENSNRSQMSQAFGIMHGGELFESFSAGSKPSGIVNPKAIAAMAELGYDLSNHASESLQQIPEGEYEAVITMGCGDECPWVPSKNHIDWDIPDPKHLGPEGYNEVRDLLQQKVKDLILELRS
jgi:arsenate reductase (thioredoxin)